MTKEILVLYAILGFIMFAKYSTDHSKYLVIDIKIPKTRFQYVVYFIFMPIMILYWLLVNILIFVMMPIAYLIAISVIFIEDGFYNLQDKKLIKRIKYNKLYQFIFGELKKEK